MIVKNRFEAFTEITKPGKILGYELYDLLNIQTSFDEWMRELIEKMSLQEYKDYAVYTPETNSKGIAFLPVEYDKYETHFDRTTALEIIIMSSCDVGKDIRNFVIQQMREKQIFASLRQ